MSVNECKRSLRKCNYVATLQIVPAYFSITQIASHGNIIIQIV